MGFRFDMETVNWLAFLLEPGARVPRLGNKSKEREVLMQFLWKLGGRYYSSRESEREFGEIAEKARRLYDTLESELFEPMSVKFLKKLREFFMQRAWTALLVPSGDDMELDRFLCSEEFMDFLVHRISWREDGLILQPDDPPGREFSLVDVFPAFQTALSECTMWPGLLLWTSGGDTVFLSFPSRKKNDIKNCMKWILSNTSVTFGVDLETLQTNYWEKFPETRKSNSVINLLHISDLHIGSKEANRRLPRVQQLIRNVLNELGDESNVVPIISGDLLDSPNEEYHSRLSAFMDFLSNLGTHDPILALGNHDVRDDGFLAENLSSAMRLKSDRLLWLDDYNIGFTCFNSSIEGNLARGCIGEQQFIALGNEIDRKPNWRDYILVGVLHHHPIPVVHPQWYKRSFLERIFGKTFDRMLELEDSQAFLNFIKKREIAAVLHGHKHIPRVAEISDKHTITIVGCGSSVGKVPTQGPGTYMSINIISIDKSSGQLSVRLLAERIPGGGLLEERRHEVVLKRKM